MVGDRLGQLKGWMNKIAVCDHIGTTALVHPASGWNFLRKLVQWYVLSQNDDFFIMFTGRFLGAATGSPYIVFILVVGREIIDVPTN